MLWEKSPCGFAVSRWIVQNGSGAARSEAQTRPPTNLTVPAMHTTPVSLLERLRHGAEDAAWSRLVRLYTPLVYHWARRFGLRDQDAADLVQDVFALLLEKLPEFEYDPQRSFRSWLRTVTLNKWRENARRRTVQPAATAPAELAALPDPRTDDDFGEAEYRRYVVQRALELMRTDFAEATWKACWETVVNERSTADVGNELGMTPGAVRVAKFRVLTRLRQELSGLME